LNGKTPGGSMPVANEGVLTLTIGMRVSPDGSAGVELLKAYRSALNYAINKILNMNLRTIRDVHRALYRELVERFNLPSRVAIDCYRDALANAKAWRRNPRKGRRPVVKRLSMLLCQKDGYRVKDGYVEITGGAKLRVIGWDRRYDSYPSGDARLTYRGDSMMLWISKRIPKPESYTPRDVIGVDVNEEKIVYGDEVINEEKSTKISRAEKFKLLAELLQKKYSSPRYQAWKRRRGILNRIRAFHRKAKNILEDNARKVAHEIVTTAKRLGYAVAREDLTGLKESLRKLPKSHRTRLLLMGYSRIERWIDWQSLKHGVPRVVVDARNTSSECPKCDHIGLEEVGYRRLRCPRCGFEGDRDEIGKLNVRKRALRILGLNGGALTPPTAPQMTDVTPNRWGEPMNRPKGTKVPFRAGRRSGKIEPF